MAGSITPLHGDLVSLNDEAELVGEIRELVEKYKCERSISTSHLIGVLEIAKQEILLEQIQLLESENN